MKNSYSAFLSIILIFPLFLCLSVSSAADFVGNRTEYKKTSKQYWMKAIGRDDNPNGSERTKAVAEIDMDYPGEDGKDPGHNRIDCFGKASVSAFGSGGHYSIQATAYMIINAETKEWRWFLNCNDCL